MLCPLKRSKCGQMHLFNGDGSCVGEYLRTWIYTMLQEGPRGHKGPSIRLIMTIAHTDSGVVEALKQPR